MTDERQLSRSAFLKRIKDTIKQFDMLQKGDRVLAAVSGGPDSVCLLKVLLDLRRTLRVEIIVGNMDHGLRGAESRRDSRFVRDLCRGVGLKCVQGKATLKKSSGKENFSVEEKAREKRYVFLRKSAAANGCNVIATGHTMDDQAETVLMRVICGSALAGISGIPPVRYEETGRRIIRPLIRVERRDILAYLENCGTAYVNDSTNLDMRFLRNRVRHEILPFLEKYNPGIRRSLANMADTLREDFLFLNAESGRIIKEYAGEAGGRCRIKIRDIILQPRAIRKQLFKELFRKAGGNVKKLTYRHWMDMDYFLRAAAKNKSLDFPGNIRVTKNRDELIFRKRSGSGKNRT